MADKFEGVILKKGEISYGKTKGPVKGAEARVESGADVSRRLTVGGVLARGVIFAKRKITGHVYLTIDHPDYQILVEVPAKKDGDARRFAALINTAARTA